MSNEHKKHTNRLAEAALIASLAATTLMLSTAIAQSKSPSNGSDSAIHHVIKITNGVEPDPNLPMGGVPGAGINWNVRGEFPTVNFYGGRGSPNGQGAYLGFNERGSWIKNYGDGKVYVWNINTRTLTVGAEKDIDVPLDLRNPSNNLRGIVARLNKGEGQSNTQVASNTVAAQSKSPSNGSDSAIHHVIKITNGAEPDPNMPMGGGAGAGIYWNVRAGGTGVNFYGGRGIPSGQGNYLGFNERGSWIRNASDAKVYVWDINTRTLTVGAENELDVPLNLRNPSEYFRLIVAEINDKNKTSQPATQVASNTEKPGVLNDLSKERTGLFSPNAGSGNAMGASKKFAGSGATIRAGILTFTLDDPTSADNGKQVSLKVMRPPNQMGMNNPNAAKPEGIAGAWMGEDPKNTEVVISLYVSGDKGSVSGTAMTGMAAQALKAMMNANRQRQ